MSEAVSSRRKRVFVGAVLLLLAVLALLFVRCNGDEGPFDYFRAKAGELGRDAQRVARFVADEIGTLPYQGNAKGALATLWNGAGSPEEKKALADALLAQCDGGTPATAPAGALTVKIVHRGAAETVLFDGPIGDLVGDVHSIETTAAGTTTVTIRAREPKAMEVASGGEREEIVWRLEQPGGASREVVRELWHRDNQVGAASAVQGDRHDFVVLPCRISRYVREHEELLLQARGRAQSPEARGYLALLDYCVRSDQALARVERDLQVHARFDLPRILVLSRAKVPDLAEGVQALDLRQNRVTFDGAEASDAYLATQVRSFLESGLEQHFLTGLTQQPCSSTFDVFNKLNDDFPNSYDRRLGLLRASLESLGERGTATFRAGSDGKVITVSRDGERCTVTGARVDEAVKSRLAGMADVPKVGEVCSGVESAALTVELALMSTGAPPDYVLEVVSLDRGDESLVAAGARFTFHWGQGDEATDQDVEVESCTADLAFAWRVKSGLRPARGRRLVQKQALDGAATHNPWYRTGEDRQADATSFCVSRAAYRQLREGKPFAMSMQGPYGPEAAGEAPRPIAWQGDATPNGSGVHRVSVNGREEEIRFLRARIGDSDIAVLDDPRFPVGMADKLTAIRTNIRARLVDEAGRGIGGATIEIVGKCGAKSGPDGRFVLPPLDGKQKLVASRAGKTFAECELDLTAPGRQEVVATLPRPRTNLLFVTKENQADLAALDLSAQARRHLDRFVASGYQIVIPDRKVEVDGIDVVAYYAHDVDSGEIIGVTEDGLHGSAAAWARALASLARDLAKARNKPQPFAHVHMMRGAIVAWWAYSKDRVGGYEHDAAIDKVLHEMDEWEKATNLLTGLGQVPGARRAMGTVMGNAGWKIDGAGSRAAFKIGYLCTTKFLDLALGEAMITLALVMLCQDPQVREQEPNDTPESVQQEIAPGSTWVGTLGSGDHDWVHLACAQPTTCSLVLEIADAETARLEIAFPNKALATHPGDRPIRALRVRFPAGRTPLHLSGEARQYALRITPVAEPSGREIEPNDVAEDAIRLREGEPVTGQHSGFDSEEDRYRFVAEAAGPRELVLRLGASPEQLVRGWLHVTPTTPNGRSYAYDINALAAEFHFYPVLEPGTWQFVLSMYNHTRIGAEYELRIDAFNPAITAAETASATAAIERATRYLLQLPESRLSDDVAVAAEAMALAALAEGRGATERRDVLEREFVGWLAEHFVKVEGGQWHGSDVHSITRNIYAHTMATLGLAEAAANGSERARELARRGAEFLIATQNTEHKPKHWNGPIARESRGYGGWRYAPAEPNADLSIHGWAVIALTAVDAAGIRVEGMRESVTAALGYVRRIGDHDGFGYEGPGGGSNVHNSIGALLLLLYDESAAAMSFATRQLDAHQWAATQVDRGDGYAFYYLYYATRAQYLRGGAAWATWRATTLRQLLRRQQADGSWAPFQFESQPGPRWTTALGLMALRLCLDQAPRYLRVEAKGF